MVGQGAVNNPVKLRLSDAHCRKAGGQSQARIHVDDGLTNIRAGCQTHGMGHALQPMLLSHGRRLRIEGNHCRQKHGIERAVVQARIHATEAVAE